MLVQVARFALWVAVSGVLLLGTVALAHYVADLSRASSSGTTAAASILRL